MHTYEPELIYALDSKGEYSDWKNVYNVSGDDICYCPICLGKVKLWNGQDPTRKYLKQRCFHHIDGMCSQESRVHFAYKTWLLEPGSKFTVNHIEYEVLRSAIEKTIHTSFGDYRPDIVVETTSKKIFYVEIKYSNKKTDDYIMKWDELGNDVIEIDVNDQIKSVAANIVPEFNLLYHAITGQCLIKSYICHDYDSFISERKIYWSRQDLINYKIQWERLDWFWRVLQSYYKQESSIEEVIDSFRNLNCEDQVFVCSRFKTGKHANLKYILEHNYTDENDIKTVILKDASALIKKINRELNVTRTEQIYFYRENESVMFSCYRCYGTQKERTHLYVCEVNNAEDVIRQRCEEEYHKYFSTITRFNKMMRLRYDNSGKEKEWMKKNIGQELYEIKTKINTSKSWRISYRLCGSRKDPSYLINLVLGKEWSRDLFFEYDSVLLNADLDNISTLIYEKITKEMNILRDNALTSRYDKRLMEVI